MKENQLEVIISYCENNFGAHAPLLPGCVATGDSQQEVLGRITEAIKWHVHDSLEDNDPLPDMVKGPYSLVFRFDVNSLLNYYKGIFTNAALEKITGINQRQLQHYSSGLKKPRKEQIVKIETALHQLGNELLSVRL